MVPHVWQSSSEPNDDAQGVGAYTRAHCHPHTGWTLAVQSLMHQRPILLQQHFIDQEPPIQNVSCLMSLPRAQ